MPLNCINKEYQKLQKQLKMGVKEKLNVLLEKVLFHTSVISVSSLLPGKGFIFVICLAIWQVRMDSGQWIAIQMALISVENSITSLG